MEISLSRRYVAITVLFIAVAFLAYGQSLQNDFVHFDDNYLVFENPAIQTITPASLKFIFSSYDPELYIPLTFLSYQIDHLIGGLNPMIFHLTSLILHTFNALFVAWIVLQLYKRRWVAVLLGLLFLVHPLNTETVVWVSGRKDVLSAFFFLLSLCTYLHGKKVNSRKWLKGSILAFALGLLAKVMVATLPLVLLLIDWRNGRKIDKDVLREKVPYFLLSAVFIVIALNGKQSVLADSSLMQSVLMALKSSAFYLQKFVLPTNLSVLYPYTEPITFASPDFFVPLLVIFGIALIAIMSLKRTREILFGLLVALITLAPTFTNYAKAGDMYFASDHYAYLPMIGIILILALILATFSASNSRRAVMAYSLACVLLVLATFGTWQRSLVWRDTETLFNNVLTTYPNAHIAHTKIGALLADEGKIAQAKEKYETSLAIRENERALYNIGIIYIQENRLYEALEVNRKAVALNPHYAPAHTNAGFLEWKLYNTDQAIFHFEEAVTYDPFAIDARMNLAVLLTKKGQFDRVRRLTNEVLAIDPKNKDVQKILERLK